MFSTYYITLFYLFFVISSDFQSFVEQTIANFITTIFSSLILVQTKVVIIDIIVNYSSKLNSQNFQIITIIFRRVSDNEGKLLLY